uniref:Uncharacterized protein n=1 Tax=Cyclopterus lumpus TaxID=8103 RepID=A0A8C2XF42_CYCLU
MHVEMGADPGRAPKHAGQKKTYKAIAETYAFLPREAVTRFLMSCGECQKRMHINPSTAEFKENDRPTSLVPDLIDYNMPLTATYLKQMKLQCMTATERVSSYFLQKGTETRVLMGLIRKSITINYKLTNAQSVGHICVQTQNEQGQ